MPVTDVLSALIRRWYLTLAGLVATVGLIFLIPVVVPVTYEAKALMVLLPPRNLENTGGNPYLALGGLDSVVGVVSRSLVTQDSVAKVHAVSPGVTYDVGPDDTISGPVMMVVVAADTERGAIDAVDSIVKLAPTKVAQLQRTSSVQKSSYITVDLVTQDTEATALRKSQIRAIVAGVVGGLGATVVMVAWLDGVLRRRKERRGSAPGGPRPNAHDTSDSSASVRSRPPPPVAKAPGPVRRPAQAARPPNPKAGDGSRRVIKPTGRVIRSTGQRKSSPPEQSRKGSTRPSAPTAERSEPPVRERS